MKLYCVQSPWNGCSTPDEYPEGYKWVSGLTEAKQIARKSAADIEWDNDWMEVYQGGQWYKGVVVTEETLPDLPLKKLVLWMSQSSCLPSGPVVYVAPIKSCVDVDE